MCGWMQKAASAAHRPIQEANENQTSQQCMHMYMHIIINLQLSFVRAHFLWKRYMQIIADTHFVLGKMNQV